ncbi:MULTISPECIES: hypothetical protein [Kitasatospora]|uniref:DUF5709 domain-containing protein n=1 Tax=Kitasatospora cystarginea TaxID=58350 RepID=A0ABN3EPY9_9ACTN
MADRERDPYGETHYMDDLTEETQSVQEQERQLRQHRQESRRSAPTDEDTSYDQDDLEDLQ